MSKTRFGQRVAGAVDLGVVNPTTLNDEIAYVIPLNESASPNTYDNNINQVITEQFGVVVAIRNDRKQSDKTGIISGDLLHSVRDEIFSALLGWEIPITDDDISQYDGLVTYVSGSTIDFNAAWLWYQFTFATTIRLGECQSTDVGTSELPLFNKIWAQYIINPDDDFSSAGRSIPLPSDEVDAEQNIGTPGEDTTTPTKVFKPTGTFASPIVTFQTATNGASIYYTIDGSTPDSGSTPYTVPIVISETTAFKVIAIKSGLDDSEILNFGAYLAGTSAIILATGQTTQYSGVKDDGFYQAGRSAGPYTINTTGDQSGTTNITVNAKTVAVSNETVIDTYTGLEWIRNPCKTILGPSNNGRLYWYDAVNRDDIFNFCDQANAGSLGGYTDWRISNKFELNSLFTNQELPTPWVNSIAFPNWLTSLCWMSTTYSNTSYAYAISPHTGQQTASVKTTGLWHCWFVRRGL